MHDKDNNKLKNFIQGLKPFSSSIPKSLKKHLKKGGYNYSNIVDNWTKIVSKKISDSCYPITIKMGKEMKKVRVSWGQAYKDGAKSNASPLF